MSVGPLMICLFYIRMVAWMDPSLTPLSPSTHNEKQMCSGFNWCITLIFVFNQGFYFLLMSLVFFKLWKLKYSNIIKYSNIHHMGHMVSVNILRKYQLVFLHWITPIIIYLVTLSMQWLLETYLSIKYLLVWPSMRFYCSNDCSVIFFFFFIYVK